MLGVTLVPAVFGMETVELEFGEANPDEENDMELSKLLHEPALLRLFELLLAMAGTPMLENDESVDPFWSKLLRLPWLVAGDALKDVELESWELAGPKVLDVGEVVVGVDLVYVSVGCIICVVVTVCRLSIFKKGMVGVTVGRLDVGA